LFGAILGLLLCWAQQRYGLIEMTGGAVDNYPIKVKFLDVAGILSVVVVLGALFSTFLVRTLVRRFAHNAMMQTDTVS
jgi:lipoprotein-releasing system permease protein